jgi:hypothetical protein
MSSVKFRKKNPAHKSKVEPIHVNFLKWYEDCYFFFRKFTWIGSTRLLCARFFSNQSATTRYTVCGCVVNLSNVDNNLFFLFQSRDLRSRRYQLLLWCNFRSTSFRVHILWVNGSARFSQL